MIIFFPFFSLSVSSLQQGFSEGLSLSLSLFVSVDFFVLFLRHFRTKTRLTLCVDCSIEFFLFTLRASAQRVKLFLDRLQLLKEGAQLLVRKLEVYWLVGALCFAVVR
jgi:hypothetical protein